MGYVRVHFDISGARQYSRAFETLGEEVRDLREPFALIAESLLAAVRAQFASEGSESGQSWAPLTEQYLLWKEEHFPGLPILVGLRKTGGERPRSTYTVSGEMRRAATDPSAITLTPMVLRYEIDSDIALFHQLGTVKMPARPIVDVNLAVRREWDRLIATWLVSLSRRPAWSRALAA